MSYNKMRTVSAETKLSSSKWIVILAETLEIGQESDVGQGSRHAHGILREGSCPGESNTAFSNATNKICKGRISPILGAWKSRIRNEIF